MNPDDNLAFEWDARKARHNREKHWVEFHEATTLFADQFTRYFADPDHSAEEDRFLAFGYSQQNRLLVVAYTERGDVIRIISARRATPQERRFYEDTR
jgi:uncharacterized DUF497 family protein